MANELFIVGGGGFAREVYILATELGYKVSAFLVNREHLISPTLYGTPVLPLEDHFLDYRKEYVIGVGSPRLREKLRNQMLSLNPGCFPNLIHPSVPIVPRIHMGVGNIICHGNSLTTDITIGDFCLINQSCTIGHDVSLGDFVTVSPGAHLTGHVVLNDLVEVGTGAIVIPGMEIAEGCKIGAGAVVLQSIKTPNHTAFGNPARVMWENKG